MNPEKKVIEAKLLALERLLHARRTFQGCAETSEYVRVNVTDVKGPIYHTLVGGLVTAYTRPFLDAVKLGPLPQKYQAFEGYPEHEDTHIGIMAARHSIFADYSPSEATSLLNAQEEGPAYDRCRFQFVGGKVVAVEVPEIGYLPDNLPKVNLLCLFQAARITADAMKLFKNLADGHIYPDGTYELALTFPACSRR